VRKNSVQKVVITTLAGKPKKKWEKGIKGRAPSFISKCFGWEEEQVVDNAIELISANLHQTALIELEWLPRGWSPATALP
jgi:hypothetical protein